MKRAQEKLWVSVKPGYSRRPKSLILWEEYQHSISCGGEPPDAWNTNCVCYRGQSRRSDPSPLEES